MARDSGTPNALADELSPYLLQHAHNPVDWLPWGEVAFQLAVQLDRPILLSIGYASCHWCHVMARESFEDPAVAELMNAGFVNVKVDREERPDVDAVYMKAVQALTGSGGWPLTAVLTPDGRPFYCGTYFPPIARHGLPAFTTVLKALGDAWRERRQEVEESADAVTGYLRESEESSRARLSLRVVPTVPGAPSPLAGALARLEADEDPRHGGFGGAPKFPPHAVIAALLAVPDAADESARAHGLARRALRGLLRGGVRDHLGGGFFRYSVDAGWRVPHFEKMLYDNAQLLNNLAVAHSRFEGDEYKQAALELCGWLERELTLKAPSGAAFLSSLDADSAAEDGHHEEGAYYVWTNEEFEAAAGTDAQLLSMRYGVGAVGELEGKHVLRLAADVADVAAAAGLTEPDAAARLAAGAARLLTARSQRPHPATDDKVLSSWNGLMLRALAVAGSRLGEPSFHELALSNARFLRAELYSDGRLKHVWREGVARVEGLLEDYAFVGLGLIELYRATLEPWLLTWAFELADAIETRFAAPDGGYFSTAADSQTLITRQIGIVDGATPSENTAAAELLLWVSRYRSDPELESRARAAVEGLREAVDGAPQAFASTIALLGRLDRRRHELVIVGPDADDLLKVAKAAAVQDLALLHVTGPDHELADLELVRDRMRPKATAYLCVSGACRLPVDSADELRAQLAEAAGGVW